MILNPTRNLTFATLVILGLAFTACKSKKPVDDDSTLPKDVALRPERSLQGKTPEEILAIEEENLRSLQTEIDSLIAEKTCSNEDDWRISAMGSKPCGGPATYVAYHIDVEKEIVVKIREYTIIQADYNRRKQIFSDCAIEPQPSDVHCVSGKAVLEYGATAQQ